MRRTTWTAAVAAGTPGPHRVRRRPGRRAAAGRERGDFTGEYDGPDVDAVLLERLHRW